MCPRSLGQEYMNNDTLDVSVNFIFTLPFLGGFTDSRGSFLLTAVQALWDPVEVRAFRVYPNLRCLCVCLFLK